MSMTYLHDGLTGWGKPLPRRTQWRLPGNVDWRRRSCCPERCAWWERHRSSSPWQRAYRTRGGTWSSGTEGAMTSERREREGGGREGGREETGRSVKENHPSQRRRWDFSHRCSCLTGTEQRGGRWSRWCIFQNRGSRRASWSPLPRWTTERLPGAQENLGAKRQNSKAKQTESTCFILHSLRVT